MTRDEVKNRINSVGFMISAGNISSQGVVYNILRICEPGTRDIVYVLNGDDGSRFTTKDIEIYIDKMEELQELNDEWEINQGEVTQI